MIESALKQLLDRFDAISDSDDDLTDTDVRERLMEAIYNGFLVRTPGYVLPDGYSLFKVPECNALIRQAMAECLAAASKTAAADPHERFLQFQDHSVLSDRGHDFNWYFGASDSLDDLAGLRWPQP
jgi:hypothetical protein